MPEDIVDSSTDPETPIVKADDHIRPPWVDELIGAVEAIPDKIADALPKPAAPEVDVPGEDEHHETPSEEHDETPHDESPVSKPWTHRMPFSKHD